MTTPDSTLRIRYYHHNHLSSTSVQTDANGNLIEENADYPFGSPRNKYQPRGISETYGFTQKERDDETEMNFFETRFYNGVCARFSKEDILAESTVTASLVIPQKLNTYSYVRNNPLNATDPYGCDDNGGIEASDEATCRIIQVDDASSGSRSQYTGQATIYTCDGTAESPSPGVALGTVQISSYPDEPGIGENHTTLASGAHSYDNEEGHKGGSGLEIKNSETGKRESPGNDALGPRTIKGDDVHAGNASSAPVKGRGSDACLTIPNSGKGGDWDKFQKLTSANQLGSAEGVIYINRNDSCNLPPSPSEIKSSLENNYPTVPNMK